MKPRRLQRATIMSMVTTGEEPTGSALREVGISAVSSPGPASSSGHFGYGGRNDRHSPAPDRPPRGVARVAHHACFAAERPGAPAAAARALGGLALYPRECHADLRVSLRAGPHLRGDAAHDRRSAHQLLDVRGAGPAGVSSRRGPLQGLGLL